MSQGESLIVIILAIIAYFLYQIARQLTFLTGRKMRFPFNNIFPKQTFKPKHKAPEKEEKLTN
jgi:hypothetical protein